MKRLRELAAVNNPAVSTLAHAVGSALNGDLSSEEKVWIERIEGLRSELSASATEVIVTDYGAGAANLRRTEEETQEGVDIVRAVSDLSRIASIPYFWALVLFKVVRQFKPSTAIELGTCLGVSAAYQAAAQKVNDKGRITSLEGSSSLAALAEENLRNLGLDNVVVVVGRFQDNLERVCDENKPIDYAFIDGHHDEEATVSYFESFVPRLSEQAVVVLDDISWSDGMRRAWDRIVVNENVKVAVDLGKIGICVLDHDTTGKFCFQIPLM